MASIKKKPQTRKTVIKSPLIKRSLSSPVILQGWLHKQGSDGFMLWKKRWFVLADYCLFYYKDPAVEKLLGSFLLASYKISVCTAEDKVYRKYSFKAEHRNMRTYYFSADNHTSMIQWVNALSQASMLQDCQGVMDPRQLKAWLWTEVQPLYANAPPKPKRISESPEYSSNRTYEGNNHLTDYSNHNDNCSGGFNDTQTTMYVPTHDYHLSKSASNNYVPLKFHSNQNFRPPVPMNDEQYYSSKSNFKVPYQTAKSPYLDPSLIVSSRKPYPDPSVRINSRTCPPRPRSADFLERDSRENSIPNNMENHNFTETAKMQRPKSSLDVIRTNDNLDSIHWSEERYAEKMRKTSMYVTPHFRNLGPGQTSPRYRSQNDSATLTPSMAPSKPSVYMSPESSAADQFMRSASARIIRPVQNDWSEVNSDESAGKSKRRNSNEMSDFSKSHEKEESMKRLLVWKQRMLQSPLTRKTPSSSVHLMVQQGVNGSGPSKESSSPYLVPDGRSVADSSMDNPDDVQYKDDSKPGSNATVPSYEKQTPHTAEPQSCSFVGNRKIDRHSYFYNYCPSSDEDRLSGLCEREDNFSQHETSKYDQEILAQRPIDLAGPSSQHQYYHGALPSLSNPGTSEPGISNKSIGHSSKYGISDNWLSMSSSNVLGVDYVTRNESSHSDNNIPTSKTSDSGYSTLRNGIELNETKSMSHDVSHNSNQSSKPQADKIYSQGEENAWGLKLDESKVIKEFSYQYINSNDNSGINTLSGQENMISDSTNYPSARNGHIKSPTSLVNDPGIDSKKDCSPENNLYSQQEYSNCIHEDKSDHSWSGSERRDKDGMVSSSTNLSDEKSHLSCTTWKSPKYNPQKLESNKNPLTDVKKVSSLMSSDEDRDEEVAAVLAKQDNSLYESEDFSSDSLKSVIVTEPISINQSPSVSIDVDIKEEHYMPMTPRKKNPMSPTSDISHSRNNSNSLSYSIDNIEDEIEESSYVEMSHNTSSTGSLSETKAFTATFKGDHGEDAQRTPKYTHYEFLSRNNIAQEPVYVEVSTLNDPARNRDMKNKGPSKDSKNGDTVYYSSLKSSLPDILNSSASRSHNSIKSDSSDADDEASKDLESLSTPKHPRFSLSDTFRPASYYLGGNNCENSLVGLNSEQQDSSDSDLVSPPPIPTSPPPNDLDLPIESSMKRTKSKFPLAKESKKLHSSEFWANTPNSSNSFKKSDLSSGRRLQDDLSSETDSIDSLRKEQLLKRRPVSADILNNLSDSNFLSSSPSSGRKSASSDIDFPNYLDSDNQMVNYDDYLEDLQVNDQLLESLMKSTPDTMSNLLKVKSNTSEPVMVDPGLKMNNLIWENERKKNEFNPDSNSEILSDKYPMNKVDNSNKALMINNEPSFSKCQTGAPYYYSDIIKVTERASSAPVHTANASMVQSSSKHMLNNNKSNKGQKNNSAHFNNYSSKKGASSKPTKVESASNNNLYLAGQKPGEVKHLSRSQTPDFHKRKNPYFYLSDHSGSFKSETPGSQNHDTNLQRRSRSFEGLLDEGEYVQVVPRPLLMSPENAISKLLLTTQNSGKSHIPMVQEHTQLPVKMEVKPKGDKSTKQEKLSSMKDTSIRHARSLDDLDWSAEERVRPWPSGHVTFASSSNIDSSIRGEEKSPYENCELKDGQFSNAKISKAEGLPEDRKEAPADSSVSNTSFEIDREKLRQWDSLSSAPSGMLSPSRIEKLSVARQCSPTPSSSPGCSAGSSAQPALPFTKLPKSGEGETWNLELSAGELLGRTHEELVLLLIQLRRRSSGLSKAIDNCQKEILLLSKLKDTSGHSDLSLKINDLNKQLFDLEKQYEKGKPLVNLVDNMVKLGSLYHGSVSTTAATLPEKFEFNQKVQEQRLLAEERKDWERLCPDHNQLQAKVKQLYKLDQLLQEESGTLQSLQQDKEILEQALGGLRQKLIAMHGNPVETEQCRRQQRMLEKELSRVRFVLAQNSKKLEETVAENARLEQELVVLRQKLQFSRKSAEPGNITAALESELKRVQDLVGDLQRQRQELCLQVRQLTEKSNSLSQQIIPESSDSKSNSSGNKRKANSSWVETDLDSQVTHDVSVDSSTGNSGSHSCTSNDSSKSLCIIHKEKPQEIKTVRIVKRESERRQRDRDRCGSLGIPLINTIYKRGTIAEESYQTNTFLEQSTNIALEDPTPIKSQPWDYIPPHSAPPLPGPRSDSVNVVKNFEKILMNKNFAEDDCGVCKSPDDMPPVYLSKAAQEIVEEVAWRKRESKRLVPREKRRHHTVSGHDLFQEVPAVSLKGSRDDLDMERALRSRIHTPDVVRSTLSRDTKFTAETIDSVLGMPNKIVIPERYIPESEPQFSKEEQIQRFKKAESIRKMLALSTTIPSADSPDLDKEDRSNSSIKSKFAEDKRQREHLLQLNQILAQQVTKKSKLVAGSYSSVVQD